MNETLWKLPVPATAIVQGPFFRQLPKRQCEISFSIEGDDGAEKQLALLFDGVEAFKCKYLTSLGSIDRKCRKDSYGALIMIEGSPWLAEIEDVCKVYCTTAKAKSRELRHLMILFDDGPCFEFICDGFTEP